MEVEGSTAMARCSARAVQYSKPTCLFFLCVLPKLLKRLDLFLPQAFSLAARKTPAIAGPGARAATARASCAIQPGPFELG